MEFSSLHGYTVKDATARQQIVENDAKQTEALETAVAALTENINDNDTKQTEAMEQVKSDVETILNGKLNNVTFAVENERLQCVVEGDGKTAESIYYDGHSLADIFNTSNIIEGGSFENGIPSIGGVQGTLSTYGQIAEGVSDTGNHSLQGELDGGTAFVTLQEYQYTSGNQYYVACRYRIDEYTQGSVGMQGAYAIYAPTDLTHGEWKTISRLATNTTGNAVKTYIGFFKVSSQDGLMPIMNAYIDNATILDLTTIFGAGKEPSRIAMDALFELYIQLERGNFTTTKIDTNTDVLTGNFSDAQAMNKFISAMNNYAEFLHMSDSEFRNASGFPEDTYLPNKITAKDAFKLGIEMLTNEKLYNILATYQYSAIITGENPRAEGVYSLYIGGNFYTNIENGGYHLCCGKGGSLTGTSAGDYSESGLLNGLALVMVNGKPAVIAVMGENLYDSEGTQVSIATHIISICKVLEALDSGSTLEEITIDETLTTATSRETRPIGVYGAILPANARALRNCKLSEFESGMSVYSVNADNVYDTASVAKVLNALVVLDTFGDLTRIVTVHDSDNKGGSGTLLHEGDNITLEGLLHYSLLESNCMAANVLARYTGEYLLNRNITKEFYD